MFVLEVASNQLKMAGLIHLIKQILTALILSGIVSIPIVWMLWKIKEKRIKKKIPGDMNEKIKISKEQEKEVQDARQERENKRERFRTIPAIQRTPKTASDSPEPDRDNDDREDIRGTGGSLQKTDIESDDGTESKTDGTESNNEQDWPDFE